MKILLVEDDQHTATFISRGLSEKQHTVDVASDGKEGLFLALEKDYDIMVVDRMLPKIDGLSVIKSLRAAEHNTPALILSALGDVDDRVTGLRAGGDDYLVKPFAFAELAARIDAILRRRNEQEASATLRVDDLEMDLLSHKVTRANRQLDIKPREFKLLEFLMRHAGQVVTRTMLLEGVWNYHFDPQTNVIEVHISRLRQKIDRYFDKPLLHTVRGSGYMLAE
ncbi:MAG: DNA-binding response regulator [Thiotrichales bacterium]|nr:DNA-binding response regulator [Thiotrichales bacterium]